jgi:serine/threonine protein kinase
MLVRSRQPLSLALGNFGLAKADAWFMMTDCGTARYKAPAIWSGLGYTKAINIWNLDVVGLNLLETELPRLNAVDLSGYARVMFNKAAAMYAARPSNRLVAIVRKMLYWDPEDRPAAAEYIEDASDVIGSLPRS